jgi:cation diffusion facilitator family transporter
VAVSAIGLGATGLAELLLAVLTGSVGLLGDAIHNLSDVSTSAVVFLGFRLSRRPATERYPYGLERAEDLAGIGIAVVIWASAVFAGYESIRKLLVHGPTTYVGAGIAGAIIGIAGNLAVARYKLVVGRRINSATLVADARHSWLDALSSAGALAGLVAVASGQSWGDPWRAWSSPRSSATSATRSPPMWCAASPTASIPRSSPRPSPPPGRCPVSCTPMPGPGGPGGPCG